MRNPTTPQPTTARRPLHDALAGCRRIDRHFADSDLEAVARHDARILKGLDPHHTGSRYRACARKRAYGEKAAHRAARQLRDAQGQDVHAYPCPHCRRWHVGHQAAVLGHHLGALAA